MAEKRKREQGEQGEKSSHKKTRGGFQVGPANLPDSNRKRHNDKKKRELIDRAILKKDYAKVKQRFISEQSQNTASSQSQNTASSLPTTDDEIITTTQDDHEVVDQVDQIDRTEEVSTQPHPDRVNLIDAESRSTDKNNANEYDRRQKRRKYDTFSKQTSEAQKRKDEAQERRAAREAADRDREAKIEAREKHRRAMAKARTATGQRKLGRESIPLLDRVKRLVGKS